MNPAFVKTLINLPDETEWVEWKHNNTDPEEIGEYISALSNSAALLGKEAGYVLWGVEDKTHRAVGTTFKPRQKKVGNEEIENWLARLVTPSTDFSFHEIDFDGKPLVLMRVQPARHTPVRFRDTEWIRVGSYKKKLRDFPEKERALWQILSGKSFEDGIAMEGVPGDRVLNLIDYPAFFDLLKLDLPPNRDAILGRLVTERVLLPPNADSHSVTNLGALLFAKRLADFPSLARKAIRVIQYEGTSRRKTVKEQTGAKGYAAGFEGLIAYINDQLPQNEEIGRALRREVKMYPEPAVRELVPNAMIHQDLWMTGTSPMVEIFSDRIEFTNPGVPLIDTLRFIDEPPRSRNEQMAAVMRRLGMCEERGSGIDKVIFQVELYQLPAPDFLVTEGHTKIVLYAPRGFRAMDKNDKTRACYQHACLCHVSNQRMTNATLRKRLGISDENYATASRIIADTVDAGLIRPYDPQSRSRKHAKYVPFWA